MALASFNYSPAITGSDIDNAVKNACQSLPSDAAGKIIWPTVMSLLYADFDSTLASNILSYIQQAQVIFIAAPPVTLIFSGPPSLTFSTRAYSSATTIENNIKNKCSGKKATTDLGLYFWQELFKQIYQDIISVLPSPVTNSFSMATGIASPPALANGTMGIIVPAPIIVSSTTQFISSKLESQLQKDFSTINAENDGAAVNNIQQAAFTSFTTKEQHQSIGVTFWQTFLDQLKIFMSNYIQSDIGTFISSDPLHYAIPQGTLGLSAVGIPIPSVSDTLGTII